MVLEYSNYPMDKQKLQIRYASYGYPTYLLNLSFVKSSTTPVLDLLTNGPHNDIYNFEKNPIWKLEKPMSWYTVETPPTGKWKRSFTRCVMEIPLSRRSYGVVIRLALPIMVISVSLLHHPVDSFFSNSSHILLVLSSSCGSYILV